MKSVKYDDKYILRIDKGDEIIAIITALCEKNIKNGIDMKIDTTDRVKIKLFYTIKKEYLSRTLERPMEIVSLLGNISIKDNKVYLYKL